MIGNDMKKALFFLLTLFLVLLSSCKESDDESVMRFARKVYTLNTGTLAVELVPNDHPATATEVPVTFGGTAVMGKDYTVSDTKYIIGGDKEQLTINVSSKNNFSDSVKTIIMQAGSDANATTIINLEPRTKAVYTFGQKTNIISEEQSVTLTFISMNGNDLGYKNEFDMPVTLDVDSSSTAVEGVNFEIENKKDTLKAGESSLTFNIKTLKREKGKDKIVLRPHLSEEEGFYGGLYPTTTLNIISSYASDLFGDWQMDKLVTDKQYFNTFWGGMIPESDLVNFPVFDASDSYSFVDEGGRFMLNTSLSSYFKNYFQPSSEFEFAGDYVLYTSMLEKMNLQLLKLKNVNRYFSDKVKSEDTEALLGVRNFTDDNGQVYLDVYVIDYTAKGFLTILGDYGMYDSAKPVATMSGVYLNFRLKKK